jgi:hypothetical protein
MSFEIQSFQQGTATSQIQVYIYIYNTCISYGVNLYRDLRNVNKFKFKIKFKCHYNNLLMGFDKMLHAQPSSYYEV